MQVPVGLFIIKLIATGVSPNIFRPAKMLNIMHR